MDGDSVGPMRRDTDETTTYATQARLSPFAMSMTFETKEECEMDRVVEALARVVVDDGALGGAGETPSDFEARVTTMKADIAAQLVEAKKLYEETAKKRGVLRRLTLREMDRKIAFRDVANAVRADAGAFNWYLIRGDANGASEVFNAGGGSLEEMKKSLVSDEVLFGLLRMGFGRGAFRRVKHIFIHWSGADVNPLKRGQYNANEEGIRKLVGAVNLSHFATEIDEINLNDLLDKVKAKVVLDGEAIDDVEDLFSLESYMVSCEEDAEAMVREFPDAVHGGDDEAEDEREPTFEEALESVRDKSQPYNWMLCTL
jgi:hypothetical protein